MMQLVKKQFIDKYAWTYERLENIQAPTANPYAAEFCSLYRLLYQALLELERVDPKSYYILDCFYQRYKQDEEHLQELADGVILSELEAGWDCDNYDDVDWGED